MWLASSFVGLHFMPSDTPDHIDVRLTPDEALVLFEFLSRYCERDELRVEDEAEQRALWNLCGLLAKQSVEPFEPDYRELLQSARNRLREDDGKTSDAPTGGFRASPPPQEKPGADAQR